MGYYVDGLKFAGGSFSLMPREAVQQMTNTAHAYGVYVSTGGWVEHVLSKGSQFFKPYIQVRNAIAYLYFFYISITSMAQNIYRFAYLIPYI